MPPAEPQADETVRNHWWWRPGWRAGRHLYACHLTMDGQPQLRDLVRHYQDALAHLTNLDPIPGRWLHLTMQEIGFADEISGADLAAVTEHLAGRLRGLRPPEVTFHQASVWREGVVLTAEPREPLYHLRLAMHETIAAALGPAGFSEPRPAAGQFTPHVSVAYVNGDGTRQPIADALSNVSPPPVTATFSAACVLEFHRDRRMYEWTRATLLPIG